MEITAEIERQYGINFQIVRKGTPAQQAEGRRLGRIFCEADSAQSIEAILQSVNDLASLADQIMKG